MTENQRIGCKVVLTTANLLQIKNVISRSFYNNADYSILFCHLLHCHPLIVFLSKAITIMFDILNKSITADHCWVPRLMPLLIVLGPPNITLRDGSHLREDLPPAGLVISGEDGRPEVPDRLVQLHCQGGGRHS